MDVVVWLRELGLGQYEAAFRENAIDLSILPDLTDQDLEKIGVLLGHRRKLRWTRRLGRTIMAGRPLGRRHGHRGLAAELGLRKV